MQLTPRDFLALTKNEVAEMSDDDLRTHVISYERAWIESGLLLTSRERQEMKASARLLEYEWDRRALSPDVEVVSARTSSDARVIVERYALGMLSERDVLDAIHRHATRYERELKTLILPRD